MIPPRVGPGCTGGAGFIRPSIDRVLCGRLAEPCFRAELEGCRASCPRLGLDAPAAREAVQELPGRVWNSAARACLAGPSRIGARSGVGRWARPCGAKCGGVRPDCAQARLAVVNSYASWTACMRTRNASGPARARCLRARARQAHPPAVPLHARCPRADQEDVSIPLGARADKLRVIPKGRPSVAADSARVAAGMLMSSGVLLLYTAVIAPIQVGFRGALPGRSYRTRRALADVLPALKWHTRLF